MWWDRDKSGRRADTMRQGRGGDADGVIPLASPAAQDIGQRISAAMGGSFIVDNNGHILAFDRAMEKLTGWAAFEVVGQHKDLGLYEQPDGNGVRRFDPRPLYVGALLHASRTTRSRLQIHRKDGVQLEVDALVSPLGAQGRRFYVEVQKVVARLGAPAAKTREKPVDPITQLPGTKEFASKLQETFASAQRKGEPLATLMVNVDHFASLAENFGKEKADAVLQRLAGILRASLRQDDFIARLRADCFGIILQGTGRGDARHVGGRIRQTVDRFAFSRPGGTGELKVTVSIGVACFPADGETASELARRADDALAEALRLGRNRVWCYVRRPRVPVQTPIYFDGPEGHLIGQSRDLSNSGLFVETQEMLPLGMRVGIAFRLPGTAETMRIVGRVSRQLPPGQTGDSPSPGLGIEFERYSIEDRRRLEAFIHQMRTA